jgi:hypothetical protein
MKSESVNIKETGFAATKFEYYLYINLSEIEWKASDTVQYFMWPYGKNGPA